MRYPPVGVPVCANPYMDWADRWQSMESGWRSSLGDPEYERRLEIGVRAVQGIDRAAQSYWLPRFVWVLMQLSKKQASGFGRKSLEDQQQLVTTMIRESRRNPSPYHTHPRLKYPVPRHAIVSELYKLYEKGGLPGDPIIGWPNSLTRLHEDHPRRYAQVHAPRGPLLFAGRDRPRFEFAEQTRWLPAPHRTGLIAHEVGHTLAEDGSEEAADLASEQHLGVKIGYDKRWPGKGLQVARNPSLRPEIEEMRRKAAEREARDAAGIAARMPASDLSPHPKYKGWLWNKGTRSTGRGDSWKPGRPPAYVHEATGHWIVKTWDTPYGVENKYYVLDPGFAPLHGARDVKDAMKIIKAIIFEQESQERIARIEKEQEEAQAALVEEMKRRRAAMKKWEGGGSQMELWNPPTPRRRNARRRVVGCSTSQDRRSEWIRELASRLSPDDDRFPRLGTQNTEAEDYHPRLCGDTLDKVLQAFGEFSEGDPVTVKDVAEEARVSRTSANTAIRKLIERGLVKKDGEAMVIGQQGQFIHSDTYSSTVAGDIAASWERQAAALSDAGMAYESEEDMAAHEEATAEDQDRAAMAMLEEEHDWTVNRMPGMTLIQATLKNDPFSEGKEVTGELWLRTAPTDDRNYGGISGGYAEVAHVWVHPAYRRGIRPARRGGARHGRIGTRLFEIAASEAESMGLMLASGLNLTPGEREFWIKQMSKRRATPRGYRGPGMALTRFFLHRPPPESLTNPRRSLPPAIGPMLRQVR